jgi:hypothetical protein
MDAIFGMEFPLLVKFVISFVIVLMLIGAAAFLVRRFGSKALTVSAQRNRQPRLAVVDTAPLDSRRSLVIVRRDNVEHLLLIGGPTDLLVEPNITPAAMQTTRDADSMTRPPAAAVLPAPNWAPGNAGWPAAGATDMAARFEPAQKVEPRGDARSEPPIRGEPAFLPEPFQRAEIDVRAQPVPAFESVLGETVTRTTAVPRDIPPTPHDNALPARVRTPATPTAGRPPDSVEIPVGAPAPDLDARRERMNGTTAFQQHPAENISPQQPAVGQKGTNRPSEPPFNEDQNLADMAQRLEAALRRPLGGNAMRAAPSQAAPRSASTSSRQTAEQPRPIPTTATPPISASAPPQAAPQLAPQDAAAAAASPVPPVRDETSANETLRREMASLLGRKPGSS